MADVEVELQRRRANGTLASWLLNDDGTEPVRDADALVKLEALRALLDGTLDVFLTNLPAVQAVSGAVAVSNFPATQPVSGTVGITGTVPVSGPLTDSQLRAASLPVSGPLTDAQARATPLPVSGPLTDAQLRATPVPVSGTVTATPTGTQAVSGPLTNTELRAVAVPVSTGLVIPQPQTDALTNTQLRAAPIVTADRDLRVSGSLSAVAPITTTGTGSTTGTLVVSAEGMSGFAVQVVASTSPVWVGSVVTEYSVDNGATWTATAWRQTITGSSENTLDNTELVNNGSYTGGLLRGVLAGASHYRVRLATNTAGSVQVFLVAHENTGAVFSNTVLDTRSVFQYLCSAAGRRVGFNATIDSVSSSTTAQLLAAFRNPVGSGVDLTIYKIEFGGGTAGKIRRFRGGTLTVGTGQVPAENVNRGGGTNTSVGQLYTGTRGLILNTTVTGGVLAKVTYIAANTDDMDAVDGTLTLRPGDVMSWTVQNTTGTNDASLDLSWAQTAAAV